MNNKVKITYDCYKVVIAEIARQIKKKERCYKSIYPIPRGGYFTAIELSRLLNTPIECDKANIDHTTLVVDDICDSGKTIKEFDGYDTAVAFVKERSLNKVSFFGRIVPENDWLVFPDEHETTVEENITRILEYIGEDPTREGLVGTPDRIIRMWGEIFRGYDKGQKPKITTFDNGKDGITYDNMVVDEGDFYSMCEHHMMPFFGKYWFAYIPNPKGRILGISKIGRVVDYCAARMQIQERLVHDIVDMLAKALGDGNPPLGMALVMRGEHLCKTMRGVKKKGKMMSSYLVGAFKEDAQVRNEFMQLVNKSNYE
ncbi:GTP cyclohydrolase I FolE [Leyella stercorea]|uniref:GTP cyclohydrolase I FolE n=1 Tax=Leyella stercorea TaxID=363265 RepID=UPI00266BBE61|nr:GTP cyclohydrolase I FolE [Leyella stercorea]